MMYALIGGTIRGQKRGGNIVVTLRDRLWNPESAQAMQRKTPPDCGGFSLRHSN